MRRWGFTFPFDGLPLAQHKQILLEAEALGYTDAWSLELDGADCFVPLGVAAAWTTNLRLGTAIANVYTRAPATLAMTAATMEEAAPGRFVLGLGASTPAIVEKWNSTPMEAPIQRVRDTVAFIREALTGQKVSMDLQTLQVSGFRLSRPQPSPIPIFLAALRPGMLGLAGEIADGIITNWVSPTDIPKVVPVVRDAATAAGRDPGALEIVCRIFISASPDEGESERMARRLVTAYLTTPAYAGFHEWLGRGEVLQPMMQAWSAGDRRKAVELVPEAVLRDLVVYGSAEEKRERILSYCRSGTTLPVLYLLPTATDPEEQAAQCEQSLRELAPSAMEGLEGSL